MISVGVMAYNQEKFVRQTMDCILAQQCNFSFEIVIGDDDSSDNTRPILEEYQRKYPHIIKLLPKGPNKGILRNFRAVMEACTGKYISFCHCDDFWHDPFKLEKQVSFLENNPDYGFVHTDANVLFENSRITMPSYHAKEQKPMPEGMVFAELLTSKFFIFTGSACYPKAVIEKYVDFNEFEKEDFLYEDLPTWLELAKHVRFKYLPDATLTYRVMENSHSNPKQVARKFFLLEAHHKMKKHFVRKYNVDTTTALEFELKYHEIKFNMAYNLGDYREAEDSFRFFKNHNLAGKKLWLKKTLLSFPFAHKSLKKIKKLYKPKTSVYTAP